MKSLSLLGSTGSIGRQTLDIVRENPDKFRIIALACHSNISLLKEQIDEFEPELVAVYDKQKAEQLETDTQLEVGINGLKKAATSADNMVNALVGSIGVIPTIEAIRHKKNIALANKETLVTAGDIVMDEVKKNKVSLMPIDSEHSAIFQCLNGENISDVKRVVITCSGGAFRKKSIDELKTVRAKDALQHPTWNMGPKITIDCATLMNKGFEVIEAHHLYSLPYDKIETVMHPESIIHSFVEFQDHSTLAQLGYPDMRIPIQYALSYPKRLVNSLKSLDFLQLKQLNFGSLNHEAFPCLDYAYSAGRTGGSMPAVLNAANEIAVKYFLQDKISFLDIPRLVKEAMDKHKLIKAPSLDEITDIDMRVKKETEVKIQSMSP